MAHYHCAMTAKWERLDLNQCRQSQRFYRPPPLTTRTLSLDGGDQSPGPGNLGLKPDASPGHFQTTQSGDLTCTGVRATLTNGGPDHQANHTEQSSVGFNATTASEGYSTSSVAIGVEGTAPSPLRPKRSVILFYYTPYKFSFPRMPQLMVVGAQGDEIPRIIVIVVAIKVVNLNNQVPIAYATFAFMV